MGKFEYEWCCDMFSIPSMVQQPGLCRDYPGFCSLGCKVSGVGWSEEYWAQWAAFSTETLWSMSDTTQLLTLKPGTEVMTLYSVTSNTWINKCLNMHIIYLHTKHKIKHAHGNNNSVVKFVCGIYTHTCIKKKERVWVGEPSEWVSEWVGRSLVWASPG